MSIDVRLASDRRMSLSSKEEKIVPIYFQISISLVEHRKGTLKNVHAFLFIR